VEDVGLLPQGTVPGGAGEGQLPGACVERGEPLLGEHGTAGCLVAALEQVDRDSEVSHIGAEVDVLQLLVQLGERVAPP
jgi:hypothetical protein